jgi:very-short-patch-repair endonuclease
MIVRGMRVGEREMDKSTLRQRARDLRKNSTDAEIHLWYHLRANRLGFKFKRQVPIGTYIVDFVCLEKRLIIELDGGQHMDNQILLQLLAREREQIEVKFKIFAQPSRNVI